ncbi:phage tail protein [Rickettsiella endosymbiont of Dermanyssus gallinae]|uniref:phage tail protein n=1 Tax=Rickettsiella endosymbiont of Dermanyssus gallinae TaxID=2856608 RepID=UPI001C530572|nr:tail fiber protein [Rickettsiella endosymbiont of Dermanyssus gallinae]
MLKSYLPQQRTKDQPIADGKTSVFNYSFLILKPEDIAVLVTNPGDIANPDKDRKVLNQDYIVQNMGTMTGGTITFLKEKIPMVGAIVTLTRQMEVSIETEFGNAQTFNGHTLDAAFERVLLIMQQFQTQLDTDSLQYVINSYLPSNTSNQLPILTGQDNQVWISRNGQIITAKIENSDISTLRSELASQAPNGGDGTSLIGYYDPLQKTGGKLQAFLSQLQNSLIQMQQDLEKKIDALALASIKPGDFILTGAHITERQGFFLMDHREANRIEDAALFEAIGTQFGEGDGKTTFNVPDFCRRTLVGAGGTATAILNSLVGSVGGEEVHTMTLDELVAHTHAYSSMINKAHTFQNGPNAPTGDSWGSFPTSSAGGSKPFNIIQPSLVVNGFIKR